MLGDKNAAATLVTMAVLAITMFLGITVLAHAYRVMPTETESGVSQLARAESLGNHRKCAESVNDTFHSVNGIAPLQHR